LQHEHRVIKVEYAADDWRVARRDTAEVENKTNGAALVEGQGGNGTG